MTTHNPENERIKRRVVPQSDQSSRGELESCGTAFIKAQQLIQTQPKRQTIEKINDAGRNAHAVAPLTEANDSSGAGPITLKGRYRSAQAQAITVSAKTANRSAHHFGKYGLMTKGLTSMHIGHVHFDDGALEYGERVANTVAVVCPGARVNQNRLGAVLMRLMDMLDHGAFVIGLKAFDVSAELRAQHLQTGIDLGQRDRPVLGRVALTEHIEINAVQNQNFHRRSGIRMPWEWRL